jgi:periplasmic copper chaperone A
MLKKLVLSLTLLLTFTLSIAEITANDQENKPGEIASNAVTIKTPLINEYVPMQYNTQIFMELDNHGALAHKLIGAYSPVAKRIQLHQTIKENGKFHMQQVSTIIIKPSQEQDLKEGGFHVMLIGLNQPLKKGEHIPLILLFEDGSYLTLQVPVI